ncbi:Tn3 family transposase [Xylella taiwanensis]|uniref:Tn3 family transposase n=1 Tax=Xylella taiwanensis TaxID=1444770 RepID=A0ABS8TXW2_9GAMM|nr:Tn3 family transposase [Xylella taiwanensis]MCD8456375.1 Tn3 family transposase [Xylella taiwanensis]MCD8458783.1 Tn3 family transposase [Xylella taiwanensis]MCD8460919.1 Tn3 family transposase [Xylella taiwanensis]MCD8463022.1 Tn3 family transposase [Xylella taiwanensis]MCD8465427.1 Tn3 family transposase [Xylella taiwanensis]
MSFHRRGQIRDRSAEGEYYQITDMNLLAAIILFRNTIQLAEIVANQKSKVKLPLLDLLAHISPLGWEHINHTGEYRWPKLYRRIPPSLAKAPSIAVVPPLCTDIELWKLGI